MNISNQLANYIFLTGYKIAPGATQAVPDADYNLNDILAAQINAAYSAGSIGVGSPPSGFPRDGIDWGWDTSSATGFEIATSEPADGTLSAGDVVLWFDDDDTAPELHVKTKTADGTLATATIPITPA